jgi:hypothetical protein
MTRFLITGLLGCAAVLSSAGIADAQVFAGGGVRLPGVPTYGNMNFRFRSTFGTSIGTPIGPNLSFGYTFYGPAGYGAARYLYRNFYPSQPAYLAPSGSGYISGGVRANDAGAKAFAAAQNQAGQKFNPPARTAIYDQWAYERLGVNGLTGVKPGEAAPDALIKALSNATEEEIASGEALNHIVVGIVAAEKKSKAESAFLPPNLLAEVRFAGSPAADAINVLRKANAVEFPEVFEGPALAKLKPELEKDLAGLAAPVMIGKPIEPAKLQKFTADVAKARASLEPLTRQLDFSEAAASRKLLNQFDSVAAALRTNPSGLVDPKWATEGVTVESLVKHVTKNKLLFGPAPKGEEEAYVALHRGLAAYLVALNESAKPKK